MTAKEVSVIPPEFAPGQQVSEALRSGLYLVKGTTIRGSDAAGVTDLLKLPPDSFVKEILLDVTTAFDATGTTVTVGDSDDAARYFTAVAAAGHQAGSRSSAGGSSDKAGGGGHLYADSDGRLIQATVAKGAGSDAATTGTINVYALIGFFADLL